MTRDAVLGARAVAGLTSAIAVLAYLRSIGRKERSGRAIGIAFFIKKIRKRTAGLALKAVIFPRAVAEGAAAMAFLANLLRWIIGITSA